MAAEQNRMQPSIAALASSSNDTTRSCFGSFCYYPSSSAFGPQHLPGIRYGVFGGYSEPNCSVMGGVVSLGLPSLFGNFAVRRCTWLVNLTLYPVSTAGVPEDETLGDFLP